MIGYLEPMYFAQSKYLDQNSDSAGKRLADTRNAVVLASSPMAPPGSEEPLSFRGTWLAHAETYQQVLARAYFLRKRIHIRPSCQSQ